MNRPTPARDAVIYLGDDAMTMQNKQILLDDPVVPTLDNAIGPMLDVAPPSMVDVPPNRSPEAIDGSPAAKRFQRDVNDGSADP